MWNLISKVGTFVFDGSTKWIIIALAFIALLVAYYNARVTIGEKMLVIAEQRQEIAAHIDSIRHLESTVDQLNTKLNSRGDEIDNVHILLEQCRLRTEEQRTALDEIEAIMANKQDTDIVEQAEVKYEPITPTQTRQGLSFVNRQLDRIDPHHTSAQ